VTDQETAPQEEEESRADGRVQRALTDADQQQSVASDVEATSSGRRDHHHRDVDDAGGVHVAVRAAARQHRLTGRRSRLSAAAVAAVAAVSGRGEVVGVASRRSSRPVSNIS